jgi:hypothetical protein
VYSGVSPVSTRDAEGPRGCESGVLLSCISITISRVSAPGLKEFCCIYVEVIKLTKMKYW